MTAALQADCKISSHLSKKKKTIHHTSGGSQRLLPLICKNTSFFDRIPGRQSATAGYKTQAEVSAEKIGLIFMDVCVESFKHFDILYFILVFSHFLSSSL